MKKTMDSTNRSVVSIKRSATLIEKLIRLANGDALPASSLKGEWFEQMREDGILLVTAHGSRKSLRVSNGRTFRQYLASQFDIRDLEQTQSVFLDNDANRASLVAATGDSKFLPRRTFKGFLVNSYQPVAAVLNGQEITIRPSEGSYMFIADYQHFSISPDVVVVGVENAENFRYVALQKYLFARYGSVLFVSRYPQDQHKDLIRWLQSIPNQYVHFGDLDLAGIAIYQHEYYCHLGARASFFMPDDYQQRVSNGSADRYHAQLPKYGKMKVEDKRVEPLLDCIHQHHKGYDQEGYIMKRIEVVAAIIHDEQGRIFATQRGYGDFKDYWEFPGGKMEPGETPEEALKREIWEELETQIAVERFVETVEWDYPQFHLTMHCYLCHVVSGHLHLKEHEAACWLKEDELDSVKWLPADAEVVNKLRALSPI